jgi:CRISPR-associated protein Cas2
MFYVVSYDVPEDGKRAKVAKILLDFGTRVQYSVFECVMEPDRLEELIGRLNKVISEEDSVRAYVMCAKCEREVTVLGRGEVTKDKNVYIL